MTPTDPYQPNQATPPPKPHRPWYKKKRFLFPLMFIVLIFLMSMCTAALVTTDTPDDPAPEPAQTQEAPDPAEEDTKEPEPVEEEPAEEPVEEEEPEATPSQQNALRSAENYLSHMAFSREGLITQLEYEGYDTADATWAADNVEVDWNEQAAKAAENYLENMPFSRSGLVDQLLYEGYTPEQAEYGVSQTGL